MSGATKIEWTDATWNPVTGCTKVSAGCKFCYAERDFHRPYPGRAFTDVRTHPERLDWPLRWRGSKQAKAEGRPSRIFVNSMSDLFHEEVEPSFIDKVLAFARISDHVFQILTKRPERMKGYFCPDPILPRCICSEARIAKIAETLAKMRGEDTGSAYWDVFLEQPYENFWLGFSAEDQESFDERWEHVKPLAEKGWITWASLEPLLGRIVLPPDYLRLAKWTVTGGESGPHARPSHPDWFRSVRDQCQAAGVPFFFKQWGEWKPTRTHNAVRPAAAGKLVAYSVACSIDHKEVGKAVYHAYPTKPQDGIGEFEHLDLVGKKRAGRMLDGREWNEFPKIQ